MLWLAIVAIIGVVVISSLIYFCIDILETNYLKLHFKQMKSLSKKYYELVVSYFQKINM